MDQLADLVTVGPIIAAAWLCAARFARSEHCRREQVSLALNTQRPGPRSPPSKLPFGAENEFGYGVRALRMLGVHPLPFTGCGGGLGAQVGAARNVLMAKRPIMKDATLTRVIEDLPLGQAGGRTKCEGVGRIGLMGAERQQVPLPDPN